MSTQAISETSPAGETSPSDESKEPGSPKGTVTSSTTVNSLEELKKKAPEVYDQMVLGIATNLCNEFKAQQERLKKIMREGQAQARG